MLIKSRMNLVSKELIDMQRKTKEANKKREEIILANQEDRQSKEDKCVNLHYTNA